MVSPSSWCASVIRAPCWRARGVQHHAGAHACATVQSGTRPAVGIAHAHSVRSRWCSRLPSLAFRPGCSPRTRSPRRLSRRPRHRSCARCLPWHGGKAQRARQEERCLQRPCGRARQRMRHPTGDGRADEPDLPSVACRVAHSQAAEGTSITRPPPGPAPGRGGAGRAHSPPRVPGHGVP